MLIMYLTLIESDKVLFGVLGRMCMEETEYAGKQTFDVTAKVLEQSEGLMQKEH